MARADYFFEKIIHVSFNIEIPGQATYVKGFGGYKYCCNPL